jgi:hypothetical protein
MRRDNTGQNLDAREKAESRALWQEFISSRWSRLTAWTPRPVPEESDRFAVYLAMKRSPSTEFVLRHAMAQLDEQWGLQVLATRTVTPWVSSLLKNWPGVHVDVLTGAPDKGIEQYGNELKRSESFWRLIRGRYLLFIDDDSIVCHPDVDEFLCYDYIGAPWGEDYVSPWCRYGSGGMSIRNRDAMIEVCREGNTNSWMIGPEDVFYAIVMRLEQGKYRLPLDEVARRFAVERIFHPKPFGLHRAWAHFNTEKLQALLDTVRLAN